jgi:rhodanese-related sulfurtransferase
MRITVDEAYDRWRRGEAIFVDSRSPSSYEGATDRLPGAIRIRADQIDAHVDELPHGRAIIAYCT